MSPPGSGDVFTTVDLAPGGSVTFEVDATVIGFSRRDDFEHGVGGAADGRDRS